VHIYKAPIITLKVKTNTALATFITDTSPEHNQSLYYPTNAQCKIHRVN